MQFHSKLQTIKATKIQRSEKCYAPTYNQYTDWYVMGAIKRERTVPYEHPREPRLGQRSAKRQRRQKRCRLCTAVARLFVLATPGDGGKQEWRQTASNFTSIDSYCSLKFFSFFPFQHFDFCFLFCPSLSFQFTRKFGVSPALGWPLVGYFLPPKFRAEVKKGKGQYQTICQLLSRIRCKFSTRENIALMKNWLISMLS